MITRINSNVADKTEPVRLSVEAGTRGVLPANTRCKEEVSVFKNSLAFLALVLLSALAIASTYTNVKYDVGPVDNANRLTLTATAGGTFTIPSTATVKVYKADGTEDTSVSLVINPTQGTTATQYTIDVDGGTFPKNGKVVVSRIDTSNSDPKPSGAFSTH